MVKPVKIPWYGDSEYAKRIIDEMNQTSFKDTDLKAKLFTKTVGKGLLECEEYYIVVTRGDDHEWWIQYFNWRSNEDNSQKQGVHNQCYPTRYISWKCWCFREEKKCTYS